MGGLWIIFDPDEDVLGLPAYEYDIPLAITDRSYDDNGGLILPNEDGFNLGQYGDVIEVNSQPWPYLEVEPRKYRLRVFIMSLSRTYQLYIADPSGNWIDFSIIASDCGLFGSPVPSNNIQMAPGERYEIIFDFAPYAGQNLTMGNDVDTGSDGQNYRYHRGGGGYGGSDGNGGAADTGKVMQFVVGTSVSDTTNNGDVPQVLSTNIAWPEQTTDVAHTFDFQMGGEARWTINGVDFDDVNNRVLARPEQGTTEIWEVTNNYGPGVHPVHVHLVSFQILERTGGNRGLLPYESAGLKDIVLLNPGESAKIVANYGPWNGLYMFHCHNLIHEDNGMMATYNITALDSLGYNATSDLADPRDSRFAPQWVQANSYDDDQISSTLSFLGGLHAYDASSSSTASAAASTGATDATTTTPVSAAASTTGAASAQVTSDWQARPRGPHEGHGEYVQHGLHGPRKREVEQVVEVRRRTFVA